MEIITNHVPRLVLDWDQLTEREQGEFDYLSEDERIDRDFIRYRGVAYDLGDFMRVSTPGNCTPQMRDAGFPNWDAYQPDSHFSGVLVWYTANYDWVVMATYIA